MNNHVYLTFRVRYCKKSKLASDAPYFNRFCTILDFVIVNPTRGIDRYLIKVLVGGFGKTKNALKYTIAI